MNRPAIDNNLLKQVFFIAVILFLGIVLFRELRLFLSAFLGSVMFYTLMRKRMFHLVEKKKWQPPLAAWMLMLLSFFIILLPIGLLVNLLSSKVSYVIAHSSQLVNALKTAADKIGDKAGYRFIDDSTASKAGAYLAQWLPRILGTALNTLTQVAALYFILYFMLINGRRMENALYGYLPLKEANAALLSNEMRNLIVSNSIGIPLIALMQGIVGLIGYLIAGVQEPWLWFFATVITAMLPVVGAALTYVPLTIMLLVQGHTWQGVFMAIWGFVIIGLTDNVFRMLVNKRLGDIHPLITIFGVIIGLQLFGFIGLIFGPVLLSLFLLLLRIYSSEFLVRRQEAKP